nr:hypothetical protein [uncultured Albidiferax sp.]
MHYRLLAVLVACWGVATAVGYSQPARADNTAGACAVKSRSAAVVVMVCPPRTAPDAFRLAGESACGDKLACNVWVWDDSAKAPDKAPDVDADLPKRQSGTAIAIWVNDSKSLVTLKPVR